jgi:type VI protein secretion system component Hcp
LDEEAQMAVDLFLKIDGIQGESTDASHADEIDIFSYTWGESQPAVRGQRKCRGCGQSYNAGFSFCDARKQGFAKTISRLRERCAHQKTLFLPCVALVGIRLNFSNGR